VGRERRDNWISGEMAKRGKKEKGRTRKMDAREEI
jgi:hypothetical protein